jgi:hypothetical protein
MRKSDLLRALQTEIHRHTFDTFVDQPPSIAQGGNGVVTPGCPTCRKRLFTMANFMDHLCEDVLPPLVDRLSRSRDNESDAAPHPTDRAETYTGSV